MGQRFDVGMLHDGEKQVPSTRSSPKLRTLRGHITRSRLSGHCMPANVDLSVLPRLQYSQGRSASAACPVASQQLGIVPYSALAPFWDRVSV